jgi:putative transcriptional regulator
MSKRSLAFLSALIASFAMSLAWTGGGIAADPAGAVLLVAHPDFEHPLYGATVVLARRLANGGHVGFIINKPTTATLAQFFPEHEPSKKIVDPLFLGGPADLTHVFALVERHSSVKDGALQIAPDLFLAIQAVDVDRIIESEADHARFFMGLVLWRPGELDEEISRRVWFAMAPDPKLVLRKNMAGLWEELVRRHTDREGMI